MMDDSIHWNSYAIPNTDEEGNKHLIQTVQNIGTYTMGRYEKYLHIVITYYLYIYIYIYILLISL